MVWGVGCGVWAQTSLMPVPYALLSEFEHNDEQSIR